MKTDKINLAEGSGGKEMMELISRLQISYRGEWQSCYDDASFIDIGNNMCVLFTTDSYVIDPIFFPGGDIGHIAVCGTVNDLAVMGALPLGLSLALIIEEGFPRKDIDRIIMTINNLSKKLSIPIATGDTKVMPKGKIDKIVINTSGIGMASKDDLLIKKPAVGDKIIISGGIGEHAVALLSKRFDFQTRIITDSKSILQEVQAIKTNIKFARDITRGGIAAVLNEICRAFNIGVEVNDNAVPVRKEVRKVAEMLGLEAYNLGCEGGFVCISSAKHTDKNINILKGFNEDAAMIGEITNDNKVILQTYIGKRILPMPTGRIVPRIC